MRGALAVTSRDYRDAETGSTVNDGRAPPCCSELHLRAQLDYVDNLVGSFFKLDNPNASSSCGCGVSFSI